MKRKLIELTGRYGKISIPLSMITGIAEHKSSYPGGSPCKTFVGTGADTIDQGENGWYVQESYETVKQLLEEMLP